MCRNMGRLEPRLGFFARFTHWHQARVNATDSVVAEEEHG